MKKIILLIASYILCLDPVFSQEIEWQNTIGGSSDDYLQSIEKTMDGGFIIGGYSGSAISGDKTENCIGGSYDYWVVKVDANGNIQWQNTIGGTDVDWLWGGAHQTSDGGYILGGTSYSNISGDKTENSNGTDDYWIVKLDSLGNILWQNTIGGYSSDDLSSIQPTADGGYILGGTSGSDISGDKTENCIGVWDFWIVKLNAAGNIQWQNTIGGTKDDRCFFIQQTSDHGYISGGLSNSNISGDKTENCKGKWDYWIIKLDSLGGIQWQNTIGGDTDDVLSCIKPTNDGGYIAGGISTSNISGDKTENCFGIYDYWVLKLDSSGSIEWQKTIGGDWSDNMTYLSEINNNRFLIGGTSASKVSGNKTVTNKGGADYWIIFLNTSGNILSQATFGGYAGNSLYSFQSLGEEKYILGGISTSNFSGDKLENCLGNDDYWIMKLTDNYNLIEGKLFADLNSDQIQNFGEPLIKNHVVTEQISNRMALSQQNGIYNLSVLDSGNYSISPAPLNYYSAVPSTHNVYFPGIHQVDTLNDFAFQPISAFNDLCVTITPLDVFRANHPAHYIINYENVGTTTLNGTVIFFPDNDVTFVSANPTATSVTTDSIIWNVGTLTPFQTGSILVTVNVNLGTPIGTMINSNVRIEPVAGDNYPGCNYAYWEVYTTGAVDPNAILVDRDTVLTTELSSPPYLNYIIYFQNTGNDTAFNARVLNPIDTFKLDIHSFEFVASSHPVNIEYKIWERNLHFTFDNILLPDSNVNEPASHGFIRYKIKPLSTLVVGDSIKNNAAIYFDFNQPVMTDTAVTEIVLPTGSPTLSLPEGEGIALYPNPANNLLTVFFTPPLRGGRVGLHIYDLFGREVYRRQLETSNLKLQTKIDVSDFSQGIYFIEINDGKIKTRSKFVKM